MLRSRHTVPLLIVAIVVGGITAAVALLIDWMPQQASQQAERVDTLMWFVVIASIVIFTIVVTFLLYSAIRFRAQPGDESDGPPIHGNTTLEILWTVVPTILLAVMAVWAYLVLSDNEALAQDRVQVDVTAEQFAWSFTYPDGDVASGDLVLPAGRQAELRMRSRDVIHSFYVPEFRVKQDVVPGITTRVIVDPDRPGRYPVICTELCGVGHGVMRTQVVVMEQDDYARWLADARAEAAARPAGSAAPPAAQQPEDTPGDTPAPTEETAPPAAEGP